MDTDPKALLALIAVQLLGGREVPAKDETLKPLAKNLASAKAANLITERKVKLPVTAKTGKVKLADVAVLDVTAEGEQRLRKMADPAVQAANALAQRNALGQALDADRRALKEEVLAAATASGKGNKGKDVGKELAALNKAVGKLSESLSRLETAMQGQGDGSVLARIDEAFNSLQKKLEARLGIAGHSSASPTPNSSTATKEPPTASVQKVLHDAYNILKQFVEYEDGLVPIPRLYHEARRVMPTLSVDACHRELEALWAKRELELKLLNDVRTATEPDKGIQRGENLYYFVYWPRS